MNTIGILTRLWKYANTPRFPLVRFEVRRQPAWEHYSSLLRRAFRYAIRIVIGIVIIATAIEVIFRSRVSFMLLMLMLLFPIVGVALLSAVLLGMVAWQVPIAMAGSAVIVHERAERTWDILLTTPVPHTDILLAKLAVGLTRLQTFITIAGLLQVVPLIALLGQINRASAELNGVSPLLLTLFVTILFVVDRLQQFVLTGLLGLAASLLADTWPLAIAGSVALGALLWLLHTAVAFSLAVAVSSVQSLDVNQVLVIGIPVVAAASRSPVLGTFILSIVLILQEGAVRFVLAWLLRRMVTAR